MNAAGTMGMAKLQPDSMPMTFLPLRIRAQPRSPQGVPQLFLTCQKGLFVPASTPQPTDPRRGPAGGPAAGRGAVVGRLFVPRSLVDVTAADAQQVQLALCTHGFRLHVLASVMA